jgi:hypothetical protein
VVAGNADICMGGKAIAEAPFFGSVDDRVCEAHSIVRFIPNMNSGKAHTLPLLRPINKDILLSLRSFWSCFDFSFSESLDLSLLSLEVPLSLLSPCRLLRELDFNNEGRPRLSTDDFLCEEAGVFGTVRLDSLFGERLALT